MTKDDIKALQSAHDVLYNCRAMLPESDGCHAEIGAAIQGLRRILAERTETAGSAEWARGMEDAAREGDHWQSLTAHNGGKCKCGTYIASAIRAISLAQMGAKPPTAGTPP